MMPCRVSRGREWHGPRSGVFVGGASGEAVRRVATARNGVVDGDGQVRAGVSYPSVEDVADCLVGLGRVTRHGCSIARWKRKATEGWIQLRVIISGGPLRS